MAIKIIIDIDLTCDDCGVVLAKGTTSSVVLNSLVDNKKDTKLTCIKCLKKIKNENK